MGVDGDDNNNNGATVAVAVITAFLPPPVGGRCCCRIPEQVVGKRIPHNAVVDHLPRDLTPPPTQAGEDATGVHHAPTNATKLFGYGAAIAAPGSGDSPGRGLDLPAQILGLGLPRGVGSNNGG